jgi:transcription elongation factor Elf1
MKKDDKYKQRLEAANTESEIAAVWFSQSARKKLDMFIEVYDNDFWCKIDWSKGYTLLDDELETFITSSYRTNNAFSLLVKAYLNTGADFRFFVHAIYELDKELIKVAIMDVPEGATQAVEMSEIDFLKVEGLGEYGQKAMMMMTMMKNMKRNKDKIKPLDDSPNCTRCGRSDLPLVITINVETMEAGKICSVCMSKRDENPSSKRKVNIQKMDKRIAELEKLAKQYEDLIADNPDASDVPDEIAQFAMTPLSNYKSIQALLADARSERMAALTSMQGETRLKYELDKSIAEEDYERSAKLRDKLKKIMK